MSHQGSGETEAAADGQPATAQAAIDKATTKWPLFAAFHAAFGPVQRLRDDTFHESVSPFKILNEDAAGSSRLPTARLAAKRATAMRSRSASICFDAGASEDAPDDLDDQLAKDPLEALNSECVALVQLPLHPNAAACPPGT